MNTKLKAARMAAGWTQEETADRAGIGRVTYVRTELENQHPHEDTIRRLCELFGHSREELGFPHEKSKRNVTIRIVSTKRSSHLQKGASD